VKSELPSAEVDKWRIKALSLVIHASRHHPECDELTALKEIRDLTEEQIQIVLKRQKGLS